MSDPDQTAPLDASTSPTADDSGDGLGAATFGAGDMFGRYLIVDCVGAGGVGEVYAAYDPNLDRRIALKILRSPQAAGPGQSATPSRSPADAAGWGHLVREAQALAKLSHPNVVGVHDVGRVDDRTYIAMELVDGVDLSHWLAQRPAPGLRATLRVMTDAGRGLHAAHEKNTVHRDFKPANVLVGVDGRARVSDFGLARPHDAGPQSGRLGGLSETIPLDVDGPATHDGGAALVGTPNYMAPEQYLGEPASVQTDVYAFCLTLHEAVYGVRPFAGAKTLLALATAKAEWAAEPPAGAPAVPRRIRQAIARGLAADPDLRWPSMAPLLAELSANERSAVRRFAPLAAVGAVAAMAGAWGAGQTPCSGAERHLDGVWDTDRAASLHTAFDATERAYATDSEPFVVEALDHYSETWTATKTESCEAARRGEQSPAWLDRATACLDRRLRSLDALLDVLEGGESVALERALTAVQGLPAARGCLSTTAGLEPPQDAQQAETVAALRARLDRAVALRSTGLDAEALAVVSAVVDDAADVDYPPLAAEIQFRLGKSLSAMGKYDEAEAALTEAVWMAHAAGHDEVQAEAAVSLVFVVGARRARADDGLWWARYAEAELSRVGAGPRLWSGLANNRGLTYEVKGDYDEAEVALQRALTLLDDAGLSSSLRATATVDNMGVVLRRRGKLRESIATHRRALASRRAVLGAEHPAVARSLNNLAAALSADHQTDEAEALQREVLTIRERAYGPVHPGVASALNNLAAVHYKRGEHEAAERLFRRTLAIRRELMPTHPKTASALSNVALAVEVQGRLAEAEGLYQEVLAMQRGNDEPRAIAVTLNNLGNLLTAQDKIDEAIERYREALALFEAQLGPDHPELGLPLTNLGNLLEERGQLAEAKALQERALSNREQSLGPDHPDVAFSLAGLAGVYQAGGDPEPAIALLERALRIAEDRGVSAGLHGMIEFELGQALQATGGDAARARALVQTARDRFLPLAGREGDVAAMNDWLADATAAG